MSVQHLSSINNAFISTVDHLPTDIVRSLWVIQACNIEIDSLEKLLYNGTVFSAGEFASFKQKVERLYAEAALEAMALQNQLVTHKITLKGELSQLERLLQSQNTSTIQPDILRKDLEEHYKKHPLASFEPPPRAPIKLVLKVLKKPAKPVKVQKPKKVQPYVPPPELLVEEPVDETLYCFCQRPSYGDMIGCENEQSCPNGDWFHYKCVGIMNRVQALPYTTGKQPWFCSDECKKSVLGTKGRKRAEKLGIRKTTKVTKEKRMIKATKNTTKRVKEEGPLKKTKKRRRKRH